MEESISARIDGVRLASLSWAAHDPERLSRFWAEALEWDQTQVEDGAFTLHPADGTSFNLEFIRDETPKTGPNWMHLDLSSSSEIDQQGTADRLVSLGACRIDIGQGPDATHVVLADPEGNEFCILESTNRFVTYESRVGSLTCEGTRAMGHFWSRALDAPLVWDQNEETAIRDPRGAHQFITWGGRRSPKRGKNRLRYNVVPVTGADQNSAVERLTALGARRIDTGQSNASWLLMTDPDDNEFRVQAES